jgi:antitoxin VapB
MTARAKIFQNGRSQAIRIPKDYRFEGTEVYIYKEGDRVILEPVPKKSWPEGFWDLFSPDPEFQPPSPLPQKDIHFD